MKLTRIAIVMLATGLGALAGCKGGSENVAAGGGQAGSVSGVQMLVPQARPPIGDLPVPIGFKLDENKSIDFIVAGSRFANHTYKGNADKLMVKRFYERQMPINRWTLTTAMFVGGDINLDFEKETERCRIIIKNGSIFHKTYILVRLWTSGPIRLPTTPTKQGKKG